MSTATKLTVDFGKTEHPLGKSIQRSEVPDLTNRLRHRLVLTDTQLDFSPKSLRLLEEELLAYFEQDPIERLTDEDIVQFVREVSSYVGEILVRHAGGTWQTRGTLWSTDIVIEGRIKLTKEGRTRVVRSVIFLLGNVGAAAVDMASHGKRPVLYRDYLSAKSKTVKETAGDRK